MAAGSDRADIDAFGTLPGGAPVERITLSAHGLTARIITWGAVLQDLRLAPIPHALILGYPDFASYLVHSPHFGAIVGRVANRIANGRAEIGGRVLELDRNVLDRHTLHGGRDGSGTQNWRILEAGAALARLGLQLPDGHMGFPGNLDVTATYRIDPGPALAVEIEATSDEPTFCSFAPHSYFNLDGTGDARAHLLRATASRYLPVDADLVPTGEVRAVTGTGFDFRDGRTLEAGRCDINLCLSETRVPRRPVAELAGPATGLAMTIETTEPGLQVYDGGGIDPGGPPGLGGVAYPPFAGIALEPQAWPDAPNRPWRAQAELVSGATCCQSTLFRFAVPGKGSNR